MQTLTELISSAGLRERVISDRHLAWLVEGSAQRRYNLVNRALKAGELVRLKRGLYMLDPVISGVRPHSFVVAQAVRPGSYVSFESALEWHGCIPEAVRQVRCVTPGRRSERIGLPIYGEYRFVPLPVNRGYLLAGVERQELSAGTALVASALRALLDLCCFLKIEVDALPGFLEGLRLSPHWLEQTAASDVRRYADVYRFRNMRTLVESLAREIDS
jgi:predicted transcriptional regulator of viral defense system